MPELSAAWLARLAVCFLIGSIPFAVVSLWGTGIDIRQVGSGNPGFNNVLRTGHKFRAALCLLGDAGKGAAALWLFASVTPSPEHAWFYGMAAVAGHCFSPFLNFNGGKGIATAAGVMLYLYPLLLLASAALYVVLRIAGGKLEWTERGTIASLSSSALFTGLLFWREPWQTAMLGVVLLAFVAWRHRKNFENIAAAHSR